MTTMSTTERVRLQLPTPPNVIPDVTADRLVRVGVGYAVVWLIGALPGFLGANHYWTTVGLGVVLPGGGYLYAGHPVLAAVCLAGVLLSIFIWWAAGPMVLPPLVWIGTAMASGATANQGHLAGQIVALVLLGSASVLAFCVHRVRHASQTRIGARINDRLKDVDFSITGDPGSDVRVPVVEHSEDDLAHLRYALDLALQPLESFEGFTRIDQFRESATRYQLNALSYSLAMAQFTRTPAFRGYLAAAQRNAIEKMLDRRVWGYWALENLWGNLRLDRNPVNTRDNIMLTGFMGVMIGMYESLNDDRYSHPGALPFRWTEKVTYDHDYPGLARAVHQSMRAAPYTLYPCEPSWIYTVCNTTGMNTLLSHDRLHGTGHFPELESALRSSYETEFLRPDGRIIGVRNQRFGLSWNFWTGSAIQLTTAYWLHAALPDVAQRTWWLVRESLQRDADGLVVLPRNAPNRLDPGNYRLGTETYGLAVTAMAAREMGDHEWADAASTTLEHYAETSPETGARRYSDASVMTNLYGNLARFGRHSALRDLVVFGAPEAWRNGPYLATADYPDVLVARAVTDGRNLELVLRPGAGEVRTHLGVEGLQAGRTYDLRGGLTDSITATSAGTAAFEIDLGSRHDVVLTPR